MTAPATGGVEAADLVKAVLAVRPAGKSPWFDPEAGETVLLPEATGKGFWVGAPSVVVDEHADRVLLGYRRRRPRDGSPNERGHVVAIAESTDGGRTFADIWSLTKHEVGTSSLERCCLRARDGGWLLYTCWEDPPSSGRWRIDLLQAPTPDSFSLGSRSGVLSPGQVGVDAVKDPYVVRHGGEALMFVSTFLTPRGPAPTSLATSADGMSFHWQGEVLGVGQGGWDGYQARLCAVMPFEGGFVGYYDGAASFADDTEEHCGLVVSKDLRSWLRVTPDGPGLASPHATGSLRYVEPVEIGGAWHVYYEYARADGSHELRRARLLP